MINQIKEALKKATPGPWTGSFWAPGYVIMDYEPHNVLASVVEYKEDGTVSEYENCSNNRHLIANTPTYIRYLLDELEKAQKEVERLKSIDERECDFAIKLKNENDAMKKVLEWYASDMAQQINDEAPLIRIEYPEMAQTYYEMDQGSKARKVLSTLTKEETK